MSCRQVRRTKLRQRTGCGALWGCNTKMVFQQNYRSTSFANTANNHCFVYSSKIIKFFLLTRSCMGVTSQACETFTYGGCRGVVPFDTEEMCIKAKCSPNCSKKPAKGPCRAAIPRWFFNSKTNVSKLFISVINSILGCLLNLATDSNRVHFPE